MKIVNLYFLRGRIIILSSTDFSTDLPRNSKRYQLSQKLWEGVPAWTHYILWEMLGTKLDARDPDSALMSTQTSELFQVVMKRG